MVGVFILLPFFAGCGGGTTKSESSASDSKTAETTTSVAPASPTTVPVTTSAAPSSTTRDIGGTIEVYLPVGQTTCGDDSPANVEIMDGSTGRTLATASFKVVPGTRNCEAKGTWKNVPLAVSYNFYLPSQNYGLGSIIANNIVNNSVIITVNQLGVAYVS